MKLGLSSGMKTENPPGESLEAGLPSGGPSTSIKTSLTCLSLPHPSGLHKIREPWSPSEEDQAMVWGQGKRQDF